jgi:hypothetical protein
MTNTMSRLEIGNVKQPELARLVQFGETAMNLLRREFGEEVLPCDLVRCFLHWCSVHDDQHLSRDWIEFARMSYAVDTNRNRTTEEWQRRAYGRKPGLGLHRHSRMLGVHSDEDGLALVTVGDWALDTVCRSSLDPKQAQRLAWWLGKWSRRVRFDRWRQRWLRRLRTMRAGAPRKLLDRLLRTRVWMASYGQRRRIG